MRLEQTTLPVGTLLRGRYIIKNILGAGHSGTVYLVQDQQARPPQQTRFALKELSGLSRQERYQLTFNGGLLQQLHHPALPAIHHIFNDDRHERVYLVTDYIEGIDLETLRQEQPGGRFTWLELRPWLAPVVEALTYLHGQAQPVFHGDIKPANLIGQASDGSVLLVDLGYAQATLPGTRDYFGTTNLSLIRAPEHLNGTIDRATDIYELGATLYLLLTGQAPLDATTRLRQVRRGEPDPLQSASKLVATLPPLFSEVLRRTLSLDPGLRFASVQAFWQALNAVSNNTPTPMSQTQPDPVTPTSIWSETTLPDDAAPPARAAQPAGFAREETPRRVWRPVVALICVLLLLGLGIGTWGLAQSQLAGQERSRRPLPTAAQPTPSVEHTVTPTASAQAGKYRNMAGVYQGKLYPLSGVAASTFSLTILQQQGQIHGTFVSAAQNGTFSGTIDTADNVQFTVFNTFGDALYRFEGGFNMPTTNTLGGAFSSCAPGHGAVCQPVPQSGGGWNLSQSVT